MAAMAAAGLPVRKEWTATADFTIQGAYAAGRRLLGTPAGRPTAVFAASDEMAVGIMLAARDFGLQVPQDLSVVGIDGHELAETFGLTTVSQDPRGQGRLAAATALGLLKSVGKDSDGGPAAEAVQDQEYPTEFVIRNSTAVPPDVAGRRA